MLEFVINNYIIFIVVAVVLLLGLFGYMVDKKKFVKYREEIANEGRLQDTLANAPDIDSIAAPVKVDNEAQSVNNDIPTVNNETDSMTGN